jgi:hypothetical protein
MEVVELTWLDRIRHVIREDDEALLYKTDRGIGVCPNHSQKANRIWSEYPNRVVALYDRRVNNAWIKDDLAWIDPRLI